MTTVNATSADRNSHYLHGTAPEEQDRLARMNELLNDSALRELALVGGEKVIDVGCGLGQLARGMPPEIGEGKSGTILPIQTQPAFNANEGLKRFSPHEIQGLQRIIDVGATISKCRYSG